MCDGPTLLGLNEVTVHLDECTDMDMNKSHIYVEKMLSVRARNRSGK